MILSLALFAYAVIAVFVTTSIFSGGLKRIREYTLADMPIPKMDHRQGAWKCFILLVLVSMAQIAWICSDHMGESSVMVQLFFLLTCLTFVYSTILLVFIRMKCYE